MGLCGSVSPLSRAFAAIRLSLVDISTFFLPSNESSYACGLSHFSSSPPSPSPSLAFSLHLPLVFLSSLFVLLRAPPFLPPSPLSPLSPLPPSLSPPSPPSLLFSLPPSLLISLPSPQHISNNASKTHSYTHLIWL